jgi:peptide/nickel transport system permease protein
MAVAMIAGDKPVESFSSLVWRRFKKHRMALVSLFVLTCLALLSIFAPAIETWLGVSYRNATLTGANLPSQWPHILGTNELGQDVFLRLIYGGRISLSVGFLAAISSAIIGAVVGLLAGFFGGRTDAILMRFTDAMLSIPVLPLMIVFSALDIALWFSKSPPILNIFFGLLGLWGSYLLLRFVMDSRARKLQRHYFLGTVLDGLMVVALVGGLYLVIFQLLPWESVGRGVFSSVFKLIIIIVFFGWMTVARLSRAAAMQLKNMDFVMAARALGANNRRLLLNHIFPNALAPIIVAATLEVGENILYEAALSFLGLGVQPPVSSWGNMLNNAVDYIKSNPSLAFWPGLFILVTVACFNFLGDGMRDALDPHQVMKSADK